MIKFYISQSLKRKQTAIDLKKRLDDNGYIVHSEWIDTEIDEQDPIGNIFLCQRYAKIDLEDIDKADIFVYFSEGCSYGKNIEFGYALAKGIPIVIIGSHTSVFHYTDSVIGVFPTEHEFFEWIVAYAPGLSPVLRLARQSLRLT